MTPKDLEQANSSLYAQLQQGRISRRQFMTGWPRPVWALPARFGWPHAGHPLPRPRPLPRPCRAATAAPATAAERPLTPTFYQWIEDLHPGIKGTVNPKFPGLNYQIAPTQGFDVARFIAEAKAGESTWDVYVGVTPFVEMGSSSPAAPSSLGIPTCPLDCSMT